MQAPTLTAPERDLFTRIVMAEAGNQGLDGMAAVAHVIRNRMQSGKFGGDNAFDVITAKHQFEPMASWGTGKGNDPSQIDANSPAYQHASALIDGVMGGQVPDPTGGATNFINKKLQLADGREIPDWAKGPGQQIGDHTFYGGTGAGSTTASAYAPTGSTGGGTASSGQPALQALLAAMMQASQGQPAAAQPKVGLLAQLLFGSKGIAGLQDSMAKSMPNGIFGGLAGGGGSSPAPAPAPQTATAPPFAMPQPAMGENDSNGAYWTAERARQAAAQAPASSAPAVGAPYPLPGSMQRPAPPTTPAAALYSNPEHPSSLWQMNMSQPGALSRNGLDAALGNVDRAPAMGSDVKPTIDLPAPLNLWDANAGIALPGAPAPLDPRLSMPPNLGVPVASPPGVLDPRLLPPKVPEMMAQADGRNESLIPPPQQSPSTSLWNSMQTASAAPSRLPPPQDPTTPEEIYRRNLPFTKPGAMAFNTSLAPSDETAFRQWVAQNKVPFDPNAGVSDYDMRGFWSALQSGDPNAKSAIDPNDSRLHYPDYWKTPYHATFSNESQWANPTTAPGWNDKDQLVTPGGKIIFDDRAQQSAQAPQPSAPAQQNMSMLARLFAGQSLFGPAQAYAGN